MTQRCTATRLGISQERIHMVNHNKQKDKAVGSAGGPDFAQHIKGWSAVSLMDPQTFHSVIYLGPTTRQEKNIYIPLTWGGHCSVHLGCALAPLCLTTSKDASVFNQISSAFTAACAKVSSKGRVVVTALALQSVLSGRKIPWPINFQIKHCLPAPILLAGSLNMPKPASQIFTIALWPHYLI